MKKFILLVFIVTASFSSAIKTEINIFDLLFGNIFPNKNIINIWNNDKTVDNFLCNHKKYLCTNDMKKADLILLKRVTKVDKNKPIFVLKYYLLRKYKDQAIGGFYWQKGRPNIIFIKENLKKFHIRLPYKFHNYIESMDDL